MLVGRKQEQSLVQDEYGRQVEVVEVLVGRKQEQSLEAEQVFKLSLWLKCLLVENRRQKNMIRKTYKYRIYPKKSQIRRLENHFSMLRHLYNMALADRISLYKEKGETMSLFAQYEMIPKLKQEREWYQDVNTHVLRMAIKRVDEAYKAFFRRVKKGEKPGFPKFKKKGQWNSLTYPSYNKKPSNVITAPKIGEIKTVYHRTVPDNAKIKTMTISQEGKKWYACFSMEIPFDPEPKDIKSKVVGGRLVACNGDEKPLNTIGIDMGLIDFIYTSEGESIPAPRILRKSEKRLKRLQRRLAKEKKGTPKRKKLLNAISKAHAKIKNQRSDFLHKTSNNLLAGSDIVCHEKLNIKGMSTRPKPIQDENGKYLPNRASIKAGLNKSINDAGWARFLTFLDYKAKEQEKLVIPVPAKYTSQKCSGCGEIVKKSLSIRTHKCTACDLVLNRDHNAAINIKALGLESLEPKGL